MKIVNYNFIRPRSSLDSSDQSITPATYDIILCTIDNYIIMLSTIPTIYTQSHVELSKYATNLEQGAWNDEENKWAIREVK